MVCECEPWRRIGFHVISHLSCELSSLTRCSEGLLARIKNKPAAVKIAPATVDVNPATWPRQRNKNIQHVCMDYETIKTAKNGRLNGDTTYLVNATGYVQLVFFFSHDYFPVDSEPVLGQLLPILGSGGIFIAGDRLKKNVLQIVHLILILSKATVWGLWVFTTRHC